jgi:hypothetical protein
MDDDSDDTCDTSMWTGVVRGIELFGIHYTLSYINKIWLQQ